MLWKRFNDQFAVVLILMFVLLWAGDIVLRVFDKPGLDTGVMGATIALFTLVVQFYFRRKIKLFLWNPAFILKL